MAGSCILVRVQPSRPRRKRTTEPTDREKRINAALGSIAEERGITQMEIQRDRLTRSRYGQYAE